MDFPDSPTRRDDSPTRRGLRRRYLVAGVVALAVAAGGFLAIPAAGARFAPEGGELVAGTAGTTTTAPDPEAATPEPATSPSSPSTTDAGSARTESSRSVSSSAVPGTSAPGTSAPSTSVPSTTRPPEPEMLREGMEGPEVAALQDRLAALHYDLGERDGVFGPDTRHAVYAFQKVHGLQRDAIVGPETRAALQRPTTPTPRDPQEGTYVEVDLARQVLFFFDGDQATRIMSVSTGNGQPYESSSGGTAIAQTPTGEFEVQRKIDGMRVSDLGELWRPAYFVGGYAIHGSPSVPPSPASHGCVRVSMAAMDRIYDLLPVGTPVRVY